jgi:hypothetical protein
MLENTKGAIKNRQSRDTGNFGYRRHKTKTNKTKNTTEFNETWWSYRYMFLVGPKVFSFVVKGVKVIY